MEGKKMRSKRVSESLMGDRYMSEDEAREFIESMDGDAVTEVDIIDEETGEVYLQAGDDFRTSPWNPDHRVNKRRAEKDQVYAIRAGVPQYCPDCDAEIHPGEEHICPVQVRDEEENWWESQRAAKDQADEEYKKAIEEFSEMWRDSARDLGPDVQPEDVAFDAADGFFWEYPKWKEWARHLGMDRQTMKEVIADYVYDAMSQGRGVTEGLMDPASTTSDIHSKQEPIDPDELEQWSQKQPFPDDTGSENVKKFSDQLSKEFGDRELSDNAEEFLTKKYPKLMAHLASQKVKEEGTVRESRDHSGVERTIRAWGRSVGFSDYELDHAVEYFSVHHLINRASIEDWLTMEYGEFTDEDSIADLASKLLNLRVHEESHLHEVKQSKGYPTTFDEFRSQFAAALTAAGAPEDVIQEVSDVDYMAGEVVQELYNEWEAIAAELKSPTTQKEVQQLGFNDVFHSYIHDAVVNIFSDLNNLEASHARRGGGQSRKFDVVAMANMVIDSWGRKAPGPGAAGKVRKEMEEFSAANPAKNLADDIAHYIKGARGLTASVRMDPASDEQTVMYIVTLGRGRTSGPMGYTDLADELIDALGMPSAAQDFGNQFEPMKSADAHGAFYDGDTYELVVDVSPMFFHHTGEIVVSYVKL